VAWCNWHAKSEFLELYNNKETQIEKPQRPRKPRKTMYESDDEFAVRMRKWDATAPYDLEVKPKGNAITQKYYSECLLPVYINAIYDLHSREPAGGYSHGYILQEDNDGSHGYENPGVRGWTPKI